MSVEDSPGDSGVQASAGPVAMIPTVKTMIAVLAATLTLMAGGCGGSEEKSASPSASSATTEADNGIEPLTPIGRCRAKALEELDDLIEAQREAVTENAGGDVDAYAAHVCSLAESLGVLAPTGDVDMTDEFRSAACVDSVMTNFEGIPETERAFSRSDFEKFADRYCDEAIRRDLYEGARFGRKTAAIEALGDEVLSEMIESGEITELSS